MYKKEKPILLKGSTSALNNNLSVLAHPEKGNIQYAIVHKSVVNLVTCALDGSSVSHRQIICKEPSATHGASMVMQAKLLKLPSRVLLVITSSRGLQMFEPDGAIMLYWYALGDAASGEAQGVFGRGICVIGHNTVCVGTNKGHILVFDIPAKGTNITLAETLQGHNSAICDLTSDGENLVSSDEDGNIAVWKGIEQFKQELTIRGSDVPCSSLALWKDFIVAGYASGHLRIFNISSGHMVAEVTAHARWISAIDVASASGLVLSVSEDTFAKVWKLKPGGEIEHKSTECIPDIQLMGGKFINAEGKALSITGYDNNELMFYKQV